MKDYNGFYRLRSPIERNIALRMGKGTCANIITAKAKANYFSSIALALMMAFIFGGSFMILFSHAIENKTEAIKYHGK